MIALRLPAEPEPLRVLCVGAHADDIEIGCGGTVMQLLDRRDVRVHWVVLGATGARAREAEVSAGRFLDGAREAEVAIHGFRDGFFPVQRAEIKELFETLKGEGAPHVVFTHDEGDLHQDHAVVGALTRETFRDHFVLGYEIPKYDGGLGSPNVFVPLENEAMARKTRLLMECFPSQHIRPWFAPETFEALMRLRGVECAAESGYAEAFSGRKVCLSA